MEQILEKYLPIIQKHYPSVKNEDITLFVDGHDHYVLLVNKTKAFRFPRSETHGKKDSIENILLKEIAKKSLIRVPVFENHKKGNIRYQTYDFINGVSFSRQVSSTFSANEKVVIASLLGKFLRVIHAIPLEKARTLHMDEINSPEDYAAFFKDHLEKDKIKIFPLLSSQEKEYIEKQFSQYIDCVNRNGFQVKVTHFDMLPEHIIVDPSTHDLSGVIDFSFQIADPARDFMFFDRYGKEFLDAAYKNYGELDEDFDIRRKFYALDFPLANLYTSIENNNIKMIPIHLQQLKDYIRDQLITQIQVTVVQYTKYTGQNYFISFPDILIVWQKQISLPSFHHQNSESKKNVRVSKHSDKEK